MNFAEKTFGVALAISLTGTVGAFASTIDLTDNGTYTQGTTSATGTVDGVSWVITPVPSTSALTYTNFDGDSLANNQALNPDLAYENDGIGIVDDEVSAPTESLVMTFGQEVTLTGVYVLDLFGSESASIYADGVYVDTIFAVSGAGDNSKDGYAYIAFSTGVSATSLTFVPGSGNDNRGNPDFALAALTLAPIPVPAAGLLLLGGLGALGAAKRRRQAA